MLRNNHRLRTNLERLYDMPLSSSRVGPLFNAFSYPTKIAPEAIALFIATHTQPGDVVLDTFSGSGTTGLATLLCDKPTDQMKAMAKDAGLTPKWGPRVSHLYEIGTLGSFVSETLCSKIDPELFIKEARAFISKARSKLDWLYSAESPDGEAGQIRFVVWSDVIACPNCRAESSYWDAAIGRNPLRLKEANVCESCGRTSRLSEWRHCTVTQSDAFGRRVETRRRVPVCLHGQSGKRKWTRSISQADRALLKKIEKIEMPETAPDVKLRWGDLHRSGYHQGFTHLHHFYTKRNFYVISELLNLVSDFPLAVQPALRLLVLSYNASHSTLMTRLVFKKNQNDLVLTGAQSGVLYVSNTPVEKNILDGIARKAETHRDAYCLVHGSRSRVVVHKRSSESVDLRKGSVDYVFTDPPFGAYIPYSEVNQINELWIGESTDTSSEIIMSKAQGKNVDRYSAMMGQVFSSINRVLKPEGCATVVFHSAHADVWRALTYAYMSAGFRVSRASFIDKIQSSFKQTVSTISVKGDPVLLLERAKKLKKTSRAKSHVLSFLVQHAGKNLSGNRDSRHLYSKYLGECLASGATDVLSAEDFSKKVAEYQARTSKK